VPNSYGFLYEDTGACLYFWYLTVLENARTDIDRIKNPFLNWKMRLLNSYSGATLGGRKNWRSTPIFTGLNLGMHLLVSEVFE